MHTPRSLALYPLPLGTPAMGENPRAWFDKARAVHSWLAKWEGNGFVIHEHRACANRSAATTSCARPTPTSSATWGRRAPQGRFTQEQLISLPPEPGGRPFPGAWGMKGLPIAFTPAREQQRELA